MVKDIVLRDLVGSVTSVTIGDARAKKHRNKKTVLERVESSCFDVVVEMTERTRWTIHYDVNKAVDAFLVGNR